MNERTSTPTVVRHRRERIPPVLPGGPRRARRLRAGLGRKRGAILVPIDFTDASLKALDYALALARRLSASVTLLHVVEGLYGEGFLDESERLRARGRAIADARLRLRLLAASRMHWRVPMECMARHGNVESEVSRMAGEGVTRLVVVGRKSRHTLSRLVFGSVSADVMDKSPCAVVVVPDRDGCPERAGAARDSELERKHP